MKILVLNTGSSSVKFQIIETDLERMNAHQDLTLAVGQVEKIGLSDSRLVLEVPDRKAFQDYREILEHRTAIEWVLRILTDPEHGIIDSVDEIGAVGHRVVHGGEAFASSVLMTPEVVEQIEDCSALAPLHNPANLRGYYAAHAAMPDVPHVAVFDTAFHQTIPETAYIYAIPYELYEKHGIRRYGFHGTSHRYVSRKAAEILGRKVSELRIITCHLGNGCSITAIKQGRSVDTSMGFTPLEGLPMGTRSGDIDPSIIFFIAEQENLSLKGIEEILNKKSGLLGVSGVSNDMREIKKEADAGNRRAQLALEIFAYRVKKYIGAYAAVLGGLDVLVFTGGIGENAYYIRSKICQGLEFLGIRLDEDRNKDPAKWQGVISTEDSRVKVLVIPTREDLIIARETLETIKSKAS